MTRRRLVLTSAKVLLLFCLALPYSARTQTRDTSLEEIRASIIQVLGANPSSVDVSIRGNVLTVSRVNTNLNQMDHGTRNGEAARIGPVVSSALSARPQFKSIHTIRVQYVARSKPNGATKIVDTIDFRKAVGGGFVFHAT